MAERNGTLLGGVVSQTFRIDREKTERRIIFIFINPEVQGLKIGRQLLETYRVSRCRS